MCLHAFNSCLAFDVMGIERRWRRRWWWCRRWKTHRTIFRRCRRTTETSEIVYTHTFPQSPHSHTHSARPAFQTHTSTGKRCWLIKCKLVVRLPCRSLVYRLWLPELAPNWSHTCMNTKNFAPQASSTIIKVSLIDRQWLKYMLIIRLYIAFILSPSLSSFLFCDLDRCRRRCR